MYLAIVKVAGQWALKNIVPLSIGLALLFSHWYAYSSGQADIEQKYEAQQTKLLEENAKLANKNRILSDELAKKQVEDRLERERKNSDSERKVQDYIIDNPKDAGCDLNQLDVDFLQKLFDEGRTDSG